MSNGDFNFDDRLLSDEEVKMACAMVLAAMAAVTHDDESFNEQVDEFISQAKTAQETYNDNIKRVIAEAERSKKK
jgi:hypothetical protein